MVAPTTIVTDLAAEAGCIAEMVADIPPQAWSLPTPAPGWTVAHQVAHLTSVFRLAGLAASDPERFTAIVSGISGRFADNTDAMLAEYLADTPDVLLSRWRTEGATAIHALGAVPSHGLVPWLSGPVPPATLAGYGMVELFGHGQDIADALRVERGHGDRLWHLVNHAVQLWDLGYRVRGVPAPGECPRVVVTAPSWQRWEFGPPGATQWVTGPAVDFCLLVTLRRHRGELALQTNGPDVDRWLDVAQAYWGPTDSAVRASSGSGPDR